MLMLFYVCMLLSCLISISSTDWFWSWVSMEMNLFSFAPIISYSKFFIKESESSCKYFLLQILGSSLLIMGFTIKEMIFYNYLILLGLFIKLAMFPLNLFLIDISSKISWIPLIFLSSFMKIPPLFLLNCIYSNYYEIIIMITSLISLIFGFQTNCLRKMYLSSSFIHLYWSISLMPNNWIIYWMIYWNSSMLFCLCLKKMSIYKLKDLTSGFNFEKMVSLFFQLLSMAGFPPTMGFFLKFWAINQLDNFFSMFMLVFLSSMKNYLYINWMVNMFVFYSNFYLKSFNIFNFSNFIMVIFTMLVLFI